MKHEGIETTNCHYIKMASLKNPAYMYIHPSLD